MILKSENNDHMEKAENTDLTEDAATDVMYVKSQENAKEESYSEIGKVS